MKRTAEIHMCAHQLMTRNVVITIRPDMMIVDAVNAMLVHRIGGLAVVGDNGELVGIISECDFLRRAEIGTQRKRGSWLRLLLRVGASASEFVRIQGRRVGEIKPPAPVTVTEEMSFEDIIELMEKSCVKRLPIMRGDRLVGIVSRANLLQAVAELARNVPDPIADDDHSRERVIATVEKADGTPFGLNVIMRKGGPISAAHY